MPLTPKGEQENKYFKKRLSKVLILEEIQPKIKIKQCVNHNRKRYR